MVSGTAQSYTSAHGLGTFPGFIHPILLCTANDVGSGMVAGEMTEFSTVLNWFGDRGPDGGVFASVSYDTVNIYVRTTGAPEELYDIFPSGVQPTSWSDFAIVVGYHR
jgi:hypothetical protein